MTIYLSKMSSRVSIKQCSICLMCTDRHIVCSLGHPVCRKCYHRLEENIPYMYEKKCPLCRSSYLAIFRMKEYEMCDLLNPSLSFTEILCMLKDNEIHEKTPRFYESI